MRFAVLLIGLLGIVLTAAGGTMFAYVQPVLDMLKADLNLDVPEWLFSFAGVESRNVGLFLWIAAGYGFLGVLMAFLRRGKQGGTLMLIPVLGAGLMNPMSFVFTGLLFLTALASFFIGPLPLNAPQEKTEDDD